MIVRDDDKAMNEPLKRSNISVKKSPIHGYGVFADQVFHAGEIIEECYVLPVENEFRNYAFKIASSNGLPLGTGSIFNHSDKPTADYYYDPEREVMVFKSLSEIKPGDEIYIYYGKNWFSSRMITPVNAPWRFRLKRPVMLAARFAFVMVLMTGLIGLVDHFNQSAHLTLAKVSYKQIQKQAG